MERQVLQTGKPNLTSVKFVNGVLRPVDIYKDISESIRVSRHSNALIQGAKRGRAGRIISNNSECRDPRNYLTRSWPAHNILVRQLKVATALIFHPHFVEAQDQVLAQQSMPPWKQQASSPQPLAHLESPRVQQPAHRHRQLPLRPVTFHPLTPHQALLYLQHTANHSHTTRVITPLTSTCRILSQHRNPPTRAACPRPLMVTLLIKGCPQCNRIITQRHTLTKCHSTTPISSITNPTDMATPFPRHRTPPDLTVITPCIQVAWSKITDTITRQCNLALLVILVNRLMA
jgi:hypothetical protein